MIQTTSATVCKTDEVTKRTFVHAKLIPGAHWHKPCATEKTSTWAFHGYLKCARTKSAQDMKGMSAAPASTNPSTLLPLAATKPPLPIYPGHCLNCTTTTTMPMHTTAALT